MLNKAILLASARRPPSVLSIPLLANWTIARTNGNAFSVTVSKPAGLAEGELLLLAIALDRGGDGGVATFTNPASMNTVDDQDAAAGFVQARLIGRIATASEPADYTFSWTTVDGLVGQGAVVTAMRITGAASSWLSAINQNSFAETSGAGSASPPSPSLITGVDNCLILRLSLGDSDTDFVDDSRGYPASTAGIFNRRSENGVSGFGPSQLHLATEEKAVAGPVAAKTFDYVAADQAVGFTVAVAP